MKIGSLNTYIYIKFIITPKIETLQVKSDNLCQGSDM